MLPSVVLSCSMLSYALKQLLVTRVFVLSYVVLLCPMLFYIVLCCLMVCFVA